MAISITPNKFNDCHIFSLSSQGSIYTLCRLPNSNPYGRIKLLAASSRKPVFLLEFNQGFKQALVPYSRELSFTHLPGIYSLFPFNCLHNNIFWKSGNAEIVSLTSFSKPGSSNISIAVSYIKVYFPSYILKSSCNMFIVRLATQRRVNVWTFTQSRTVDQI